MATGTDWDHLNSLKELMVSVSGTDWDSLLSSEPWTCSSQFTLILHFRCVGVVVEATMRV